MRPDEYLDDDEEEGFSSRSIFASGWFRALMVLGVLGIVLVVTLPYAFKWIESAKPAVAKRDAAPAPEARPTSATPSVTPVTVPTPGPPPAAAEKPAGEEKPVATTVPLPATPVTPSGPAESSAGVKASAEKPSAPAKAAEKPATAEKPAPAPKAAATEKPAAKHAAEAAVSGPSPVRKSAAAPASAPQKGGDFFIQVGVFQDGRNADRLAKSLRAKHLPVQVSRVTGETTTAAAATRHEVFVTGSNPQVVNAALRGNGAALAVRGGVAVQPSLELKDAVALSRKLSGEGLNVQIRRVGGDTAAASAAGVRHLVRVGGYATRAEAQAVRTQLQRDGISAFVTPVATQ